jgi:hypothetical protein
MGIITGLVASGVWLLLWLFAWATFGLSLPIGVVGLVVGLVATFSIGVRLGDPSWRRDPVSRVEQRQRARQRFEARTQPLETEDRVARLARADREADERAEARVRALVERRAATRDRDDPDSSSDGGAAAG